MNTTETDDQRAAEVAKYRHLYAVMPNYRMGDLRSVDARADIRNAHDLGARSYLDIGCGRGEMLDFAEAIGFEIVAGAEAVADLCGERVMHCQANELGQCPDNAYDLVSSFDVLEHLLPGDDVFLIQHAGRIAASHIVLTANNHPSVDPTTGNDLHINIRSYEDWDRLIRTTLAPEGWHIERMANKQYVSETWRAWR